ncbi:GGDEF domain-containing protein [Colwellia sp. 75C3]|uniref:tetratricopeptide repeat-containing diguanylate cyclase n=1 Tax=Colwellia sp. 75C3 TaxID=888425 RepID=UPI000C333CC1|nr:GGDEF domain-containing protein [Colwellia sp. 75C3]PKG83190.1 GGDEF domain-containing protein [Colwellia sp. 75C3]
MLIKTNSAVKNNTLIFSFFVLLFFVLSTSIQTSLADERTKPKQFENKNLTLKEINDKLQLADKNRRSNPTEFKKLIFELKEHQLTDKQQQYLDALFAFHFIYSGEYDKAEPKLKTLLKKNTSNLIKFRVNYSLIVVAAATKNWAEGLEYITTNIKLLPTINNTEHYQNGLLTIIVFYSQLGQYQLALSYIDKLSQQKLPPKNNCALKQLSLEAKFNLNQLKLDDNDFEDAVAECINADFLIPAHIVRTHKAKLYLQNDAPQKSLDFLLKYLEPTNSTQYPMLIAEVNNIIAKAYLKIDDVKSAKNHAIAALAINSNVSNILQGVETYSLLYQVAKKQQDLPLALKYFEKYSEIEKAHLEGEKAKHLAFQLAEHNAFEQESQIQLLNEKNHSLATEQTLEKTKVANRQLIILLLSFIILILAFVGMRFWRTHKRVKELAEYDPLTGIYNRGHFTHVTNSALKYCKNAEQELSVIMFDLDHFKKVNDSFGHACGDWALKETIKVCQNIGRKNDIFARLGGEEFCLVLPSCNIAAAMLRAEACRAAIEEIITEESGYDFSITASFGVTDARCSGFDLDKLLADADFAAYASKKTGRNKVTMFEVPETEKTAQLNSAWNYN